MNILDSSQFIPVDQATICVCGKAEFARWGRHHVNGKQRWICTACGRTRMDVVRCGLPGIRTSPFRIVQFVRALENGESIRSSSRKAGIKHCTGSNIIQALGYRRSCRTCGKELTGIRIRFCSDACQVWRRPKPKTGSPQLYDATANLATYIHKFSCADHGALAFEFAQEISELRAAEFVGACFEGISQGCKNGVTSRDELKTLAMASVKQHWKEIRTYGHRSLDGMKEDCRFEALAR